MMQLNPRPSAFILQSHFATTTSSWICTVFFICTTLTVQWVEPQTSHFLNHWRAYEMPMSTARENTALSVNFLTILPISSHGLFCPISVLKDERMPCWCFNYFWWLLHARHVANNHKWLKNPLHNAGDSPTPHWFCWQLFFHLEPTNHVNEIDIRAPWKSTPIF